ncbi:SpoIID/LytB domain-containing protein [Paraflavitalea speifideaquila]|uniref:SpoIID/LytB domain-containing protein n=1 Tax=Paraflavitalea speifideaquila TaxID=3076558 RepID=UPI0028EE9A80|nr:carboxypeptidase regulatory-like domain-containing protein [Paraflavitalea speifideiaquila]
MNKKFTFTSRKALAWLLCACVLLLQTQLQAQQISVIVQDQQTGFAVAGATINVTTPSGKSFYLQAAKNGKTQLSTGSGRYNFSITAPGYHTLETYFDASAITTIEANINLDPINNPPSNEARQWPGSKDQLILSGYIRDGDENAPLESASIKAGAYTAITDRKGFFSLEIPVAANIITEGKTPPTITIQASKKGYATYTIQNFYAIPDTYTLKLALTSAATLKQQPGNIPPAVTETYHHGLFDRAESDEQERYKEPTTQPIAQKNEAAAITLAVAVPGTIRVGTSCSCTSCSVVQVMSLEAYTQSGLDDEWIASWGAASLQAGAVAYRTYGAWYVLHPVAGSYDIAATTCNQAWQNDIATSTKNAAIATAGTVLLKSGAIFRSEYSAENNNSGCGNGYSGTGTSWPCISDARCAGRTKNGHGRGMCQWGSSFWASDKTYLWILNHYYNPGGVTVQLPASPAVTTLSFTVKDQNTGTAIASASIAATKVGGSTTTLTTNASGQVVFGADTGRYNVTISKSGYMALTTFS